MAISSELEQLLASWIPRQSWFPKLAADFGSDPDITPMSVARAFTYTAEELGGFVGLVTVISVGDGPTLRRLNIPLTLRGTEDIHLRHALIGKVDDLALGSVFVYDGAADPVFVNLMADAITKRKVFDGGQLSTESLRHSQEKAASREQARMPFPVTTNAGSVGAGAAGSAEETGDTSAEVAPPKPSKADLDVTGAEEMPVDIRPIEVSDSGPHKSTVIIHDEYEPMELSFFRVLENGMPSSLTIPVLLTEAGSRSVPEVIGWGSGKWYDMFEVTEMEAPMALLSHVDVEAEPAWREAVDTVCSVDSGSIGAYNAHAAEMGRRIGELHSDMAAEFGIVEGAGEPTKQLVTKWIERIDWALGRAPLALDSLVPELRGHRSKLQGLLSIGTLQKIHGELTLDHVVSSPSDGYSVVKFTDSANSDPKPVALDLVALLRSIDYAAGFARLQRTEELETEDSGLVVNGFGNDPAALRAIFDSPEYLWASQVQNSLLSGYSRARGESIGLSDPVLRGALIDRLLVEVVTELRNRPKWLSVPLSTLTLVLKGKPSRSGDLPTEVELSTPDEKPKHAAAAVDAAAGAAPVQEDSESVGTGSSAVGTGSIAHAHDVVDHEALVDGVSTEAAAPVVDSTIAEAGPEVDGFDDPNVEAPGNGAETTATSKATEGVEPNDGAETTAGPDSNEDTTASASDSEDGRTAAEVGNPIADAPQTKGEKLAEEVRITGGASTSGAYVDAVTTETVEPVEPVPNEAAKPKADEADEPADNVAEPGEAAEPAEAANKADQPADDADQSTEAAEAKPVTDSAAADSADDEDLVDDEDLGDDEEFGDEPEEEVVVKRVPASFAARGATSEGADSTGHEAAPAKPTKAPKLGKSWAERTEGERAESSDKSADSSSGSVFGDLSDKAKKRHKH